MKYPYPIVRAIFVLLLALPFAGRAQTRSGNPVILKVEVKDAFKKKPVSKAGIELWSIDQRARLAGGKTDTKGTQLFSLSDLDLDALHTTFYIKVMKKGYDDYSDAYTVLNQGVLVKSILLISPPPPDGSTVSGWEYVPFVGQYYRKKWGKAILFSGLGLASMGYAFYADGRQQDFIDQENRAITNDGREALAAEADTWRKRKVGAWAVFGLSGVASIFDNFVQVSRKKKEGMSFHVIPAPAIYGLARPAYGMGVQVGF